ncbi:MAG TPA: hypothetical protein PLU95_08855 [Syntrophales bacterium]|nr:hypothetical protein [Syntrophales bacterium]HPX81259.1 hypothetical protein [Syntrophales bacterium]HQB14908.1 hypothetical protein [Syntrophales bacterium]
MPVVIERRFFVGGGPGWMGGEVRTATTKRHPAGVDPPPISGRRWTETQGSSS